MPSFTDQDLRAAKLLPVPRRREIMLKALWLSIPGVSTNFVRPSNETMLEAYDYLYADLSELGEVGARLRAELVALKNDFFYPWTAIYGIAEEAGARWVFFFYRIAFCTYMGSNKTLPEIRAIVRGWAKERIFTSWHRFHDDILNAAYNNKFAPIKSQVRTRKLLVLFWTTLEQPISEVERLAHVKDTRREQLQKLVQDIGDQDLKNTAQRGFPGVDDVGLGQHSTFTDDLIRIAINVGFSREEIEEKVQKWRGSDVFKTKWRHEFIRYEKARNYVEVEEF
ncbi:hypothetical protein P280DRAFT_471053 [Massarina eburnea CBS 473.64]|uniref:Uncharacterized protein n=1 Tax=Massarina eburnea CBS 473.64 TaxID=1395130 RepID=A0A6A6RYK8_9PLEO|nr:hypothetical protein P280DRAFT_471053 [Massarina eburnea CBS 473.64]